MDFELNGWEQGWYGAWIDLKGDTTPETVDAAMKYLLEEFEAMKGYLRQQSLYLSAAERLWMHRPGKSIAWKAPAKPLKEISHA